MQRIGGIAATLFIHGLFLQPFVLGSHAVKRLPPEESGPGASAASSDDSSYMTLVMVSLPSDSQFASEGEYASSGVVKSDSPIQVASPDPAPWLAPDQFEAEEIDDSAAHTAGDPAIQSRLFGSYTSQIDARIQRAWRKPRSEIAPPTKDANGRLHRRETFPCQARIAQDAGGNVMEIELIQCDGSTEWQMSLVNAIQRASPLPAPPSPTVFTSVLMLSFEGKAYVPGYREDEYEPAAASLARSNLLQ